MKIAAVFLLALLAAGSPKPKVEFKPLQRISSLSVSRCEAVVIFKLTVDDGGSEDYYCPKVVFEWEDGTQSSEESDCVPFDQAGKDDHSKTWTKSHSFHTTGTHPVRAHLCQASRKIRVIETNATITGSDRCSGDSGQSSDAMEERGIENPEGAVRPMRQSRKDPCAEPENSAH
ncbi:MAG: hypothetical protein ABI565_06015 [Vicinamibacteria bacterium]